MMVCLTEKSAWGALIDQIQFKIIIKQNIDCTWLKYIELKQKTNKQTVHTGTERGRKEERTDREIQLPPLKVITYQLLTLITDN